MPASIFLATATAAALAGCPAPEAPIVDVTSEVSGVEIVRRTPREMEGLYDVAATMARRVHPVGLTHGDTHLDSTYTFLAVPTKNGQVCLWPKRIQVRVETASIVSVSKDVGRNTCEWHAVLEHEMRHVEADRMTAWRATFQIRDKMREAAIGYGPFNRADMADAKLKLIATLEASLKVASDQMYAARDKAQDAVDSEEEYARVASRCTFPDVFVVNGATARGALLKNSLPSATFVRSD
ncbi:hypothetical protein [Roseiterribacter gracilis]|uniref:Lipoprotein n=1 Tax=Roseiterribacter gracilis TaxID=2812848 RepID=A0A8S8X7V5_9PROT|nr:hypothetical protein TMPK1_16700 [Rhodospirillales bacterium TMPK1]